jgi:adenylate kinase
MNNAKVFPKVIMFFGPPGSGKGTQANLLSEEFGFRFLDWGHEFRQFVSHHRKSQDDPEYQTAARVQEYMLNGLPILTEDLQHIIGKAIRQGALESKDSFIMDKCGVKVPEAQWLSKLLLDNQIPNILFHLPLSLEDSIKRISNRYYVPGSIVPYSSYDEALSHCPDKVLPLKRQDENTEITTTRYNNLYYANHLEIINTYRSTNFTDVVDIDASQNVDEIHAKILDILHSYQPTK